MRTKTRARLLAVLAMATAAAGVLPVCASDDDHAFPSPAIGLEPRRYVCRRAEPAPEIDGLPNDPCWSSVQWTEEFVDIEGERAPLPHLATRAAILWDDDHLYVAAILEEPHVWATLTERDAVIYHDDDFEVFIDPDGDTHEYYELEINALGTVWDLLLTKPYRDDGTAIDSWDVRGLLSAVHIDGTLNDPSDVDSGWTVEMAIPWSVLEECAHGPAPPEPGDRWRINFSRVDWTVEHADGRYAKVEDPETGRTLAESNCVWSPQGLVAMHYPEMWGFVLFSDAPAGARGETVPETPGEAAARELFGLYYAERTYERGTGSYTDDVRELGLKEAPDDVPWPPAIWTAPGSFLASLRAADGSVLSIDQDGRLRREPPTGNEP